MQSVQSNSAVTWCFPGVTGAGKATLPQAWASLLRAENRPRVVMDCEELRRGQTRDLGFTTEDRLAHMRRVAEVTCLLNDSGIDEPVALVSPTPQGRANANDIVGSDRFVAVYLATPLAVCQARDPKRPLPAGRKQPSNRFGRRAGYIGTAGSMALPGWALEQFDH